MQFRTVYKESTIAKFVKFWVFLNENYCFVIGVQILGIMLIFVPLIYRYVRAPKLILNDQLNLNPLFLTP